jgi:hypothetical protein
MLTNVTVSTGSRREIALLAWLFSSVAWIGSIVDLHRIPRRPGCNLHSVVAGGLTRYAKRLTISLAILLMLGAGTRIAFAQTPFYDAKLEPPAGRIIHGWGQFSSEWDKGAPDGAGDAADLAAYERAVKPTLPAMLSFYTALDASLMQQFTERYKQRAAQRGFFVTEVGLNFQNVQKDASQGMRDPEVVMMLDVLRDAHNPVLLRIGYEFNNPRMPYDPSLYIQTFRGVVERIREGHNDNVAAVWNATAAGFDSGNFMRWYPGDDVVDWWGIDLFDLKDFDRPELAEFLEKARSHRKPVVICEASPVFQASTAGHVRGPKSDVEAAAWFQTLVDLIDAHPEIQAVSLISVDWRRLHAILPGSGWPDVRITQWPKALAIWKKALTDKRFINAPEAEAVLHIR